MLIALILFSGAMELDRPAYKQSGEGIPPDLELPLRYATPLARVARLEIAVKDGVVEQAGAATIEITVRNISDQAFVCHCDFKREAITLAYALKGEAPVSLRPSDDVARGLAIVGLHLLEPGEMAGGSMKIRFDYGRSSAAFDRPGVYEVRATYDDHLGRPKGGRLVSEAIEITVLDPESTDGRQALAAFTPALQRFVDPVGGTRHAEKVFREAISFVERFGGTTYGEDVRRRLIGFLAGKAFVSGMAGGELRVGAEEYADLYRRMRSSDVPVRR